MTSIIEVQSSLYAYVDPDTFDMVSQVVFISSLHQNRDVVVDR